MEFVILFFVIGLIGGVTAVALIGKSFLDTLPEIDDLLWDDVEWDEVDEDKKLQPLLGVVHPRNHNLL